MPEFVDDKVYTTLIKKIDKTLREVRNDPQHELRLKFRQSLDEFIIKLKTSPEYATKAEQIKEELLENPMVRQYVGRVWDDVKGMILQDVAQPDSAIARHIDEGMQSVGTKLLDDEKLREQLNTTIQTTLTNLISERKHEVATLIADTVKRWDADTIADKFETQVGKDLQFIRINGTLVGGLVGLVIYTLSYLLS
jgi:uncharacterized membrane-anchored protein YjiN (DUF445 family)